MPPKPEIAGQLVFLGTGTSVGVPVIVNNTVAQNNAPWGSAVGGAGSTGPSMFNNLLIGADGQSAIFCGFGTYHDLPTLTSNDIFTKNAPATLDCNDAPGTETGNIAADPGFVNAAHGDYRLRPGSPAIDAGTNSAPSLSDTDLRGGTRVTDGNGDGVNGVDQTAARESRAKNRHRIGGNNKDDVPDLQHAFLLLHHDGVQVGGSNQPRHQRSIFNRVPGPESTPSEFVVGPIAS